MDVWPEPPPTNEASEAMLWLNQYEEGALEAVLRCILEDSIAVTANTDNNNDDDDNDSDGSWELVDEYATVVDCSKSDDDDNDDPWADFTTAVDCNSKVDKCKVCGIELQNNSFGNFCTHECRRKSLTLNSALRPF